MNSEYDEIMSNYMAIRKNVQQINPNAKIMAVSKFQPFTRIQPLLDQGHRLFGESRIEEAAMKWEEARAKYHDLELHYIGGIQSKKIPKIVDFFDAIQSVDRPSVVEKIASHAHKISKKMRIYIQVNIGNESQKRGVLVDDLPFLFDYILTKKEIFLEGIMCIPPNNDHSEIYFKKMKELFNKYQMVELSMGMSNDYATALLNGSTFVRIGSSIFGERRL